MAIFDPFYIGTPGNRITFNDENNNPYFRVIRRYPTRREVREFDIDLPESIGIADFESWIGKTYMVIEGKMYPNDETSFHSGREILRKLASLSVEQSDSSSDQGYVPMVWSENISKMLNLKVMYVDMQESTSQGIIQPFRLLCKIKYPVVLSTQFSSATLTIGTSSSALTGAVIPSSIPMTIGAPVTATSLPFTLPVVLGSTAGSGSLTVTNSGDLPAFPTITIYGPVNKPRITNTTSGEYVELSVNLATSSDSAVLSYDSDSVSVVAQGQNAYGKLTSGSTLFKVKPGANTFTLTGSSVGTGAKATVSCQSTYSLS